MFGWATHIRHQHRKFSQIWLFNLLTAKVSYSYSIMYDHSENWARTRRSRATGAFLLNFLIDDLIECFPSFGTTGIPDCRVQARWALSPNKHAGLLLMAEGRLLLNSFRNPFAVLNGFCQLHHLECTISMRHVDRFCYPVDILLLGYICWYNLFIRMTVLLCCMFCIGVFVFVVTAGYGTNGTHGCRYW